MLNTEKIPSCDDKTEKAASIPETDLISEDGRRFKIVEWSPQTQQTAGNVDAVVVTAVMYAYFPLETEESQ